MPPQGNDSAPKALVRAARRPRPPRRDARKPLPIKISLRTGPDPWVEVELRVKGEVQVRRFHGQMSILDVTLWLSGWN